MSLILNEKEIYADTYETNWNYLRNMTEVQMKLLEDMDWNGAYINNSLSDFPWTGNNRKYAKISVEAFRNQLNNELMRL